MPKRISAKTSNEELIPCKNGHTGKWGDQPVKGKSTTKRCNQCTKDKARQLIYGLTPGAFKQLHELNPVCGICGEDGKDHGMGILEIDHDHTTNEVRGLLCRRCNIFLGHYESRKHLIPAAERYLLRVK